jgi:hypothetical protein
MNRTTETVVHFSREFLLPGFDKLQPAGDYRVDHDEVEIDDVTRIAWLRVGSFIHLPSIGRIGATVQMVPISPADLEEALRKDLG